MYSTIILMDSPTIRQGLSKCTMGATILNRLLHNMHSDTSVIPSGFASRFFKLQEEKICTPMWDATKTQG